MQVSDRRRLNGPTAGTSSPCYRQEEPGQLNRTRQAQEHRRIFLKTGIVPSAAGSAYYELQLDGSGHNSSSAVIAHGTSGLKLSVTVHGPRPLPRGAAYSSNLLLTTHVKFAPFATRVRRGYVRDWSERDLGVHLESALRGVIIGERWPKSAIDVVVTILEAEDASSLSNEMELQGTGMMTALAGAITASSAALVEAGIDCVDLVSGGVAGLSVSTKTQQSSIVIDPVPAEQKLAAACVVAYLQSRDEVTELWMRGDAGSHLGALIDNAIASAKLERGVLTEAAKESVASPS